MTRPRSLELVTPGARQGSGLAANAAGRAVPERVVPAAPGRGVIDVQCGPDGRSRVVQAYATSPLRLLAPTNHGHGAWVYTSSYGGGLVDGDTVSIGLTVGGGATAFVSTQASTKVYRSFRGAESRLRAQVDAGAVLVFAPDPVVCFGGARYRQEQTVSVAAGGGLVLVDWVTSGRRAAGERWQFDEYVAHAGIDVGGQRCLYDTLSLRAAHGDLAARLGRFDVLALVVIAGTPLDESATAVIARVGQTRVSRRADLLVSAAPLRTGGCAVRIAGRSVEQVGEVIEQVLDFVPALLGDNPWSRKW